MEREDLIITLSGRHGTGKSVYSGFLANKLKLKLVSSGFMFRRKAEEMKMTVPELSKLAERDPKIDREIDERMMAETKKGGVVAEGLLPGWLLKDEAHIKILLTAPFEVSRERIANREGKTAAEVANETELRETSEKERFLKYYAIDISDASVYDLVLDTSLWDIDTIRSILLELARSYLKTH